MAIVGSGFAGLGMAIRLQQAGHRRLRRPRARRRRRRHLARQHATRAARATCPSHLYSFSFAPNPDWTRTFSPQPEIWAYLRGCAERFGVRPHIRFGHEVLDAALGRRRAALARSRPSPRRAAPRASLVAGGRRRSASPSIPDLPGLERFEGTVFHSARWDHDHDLDRRARRGRSAPAPRRSSSCPQIQPQVGAPARSSSARRRGSCRTPTGPLTAWRAAPVPPPARRAALVRAAHLLGARVARARRSATRALMRLAQRLALAPPAPPGPRPASCARKLTPRLHASAASAS